MRQLAAGLTLAVSLAASPVQAAITVFESAAAQADGIVAMRDSFRAAVGGGSVAADHGDFGGLRREINWDGVPDGRADPNALPADFFNVNSPRGVVFSAPQGASFAVSAHAGLGTPALFGFAGDLQAFSAQRLFATVGSRSHDIRFFVPGTANAATTSAFAAVFVDVENDNTIDFTTMEFFDQNDALIFSRHVLVAGNQGLSFLGGAASAGERIGRVRITTPDNYLISSGQRRNEINDFVVMDDFLYATPSLVPEPAAWAMALLGLGVFGLKRRRRA